MMVPQINDQTGVSADYWNEYFGKSIWIERGLPYFVRSIKSYPVRKYEQRFSPERYEDVITTQNRARVARLNELSDAVNAFTDVSLFTELELKRVINEAYNLIYGKGEIDFYPEVHGHQ